MIKQINKKNAERYAVSQMLKTGHCAQAIFGNLQKQLKSKDIQNLFISTSGLAGGIGFQGAACGALTGGALGLSLLTSEPSKDVSETVRKCMNLNKYAHRFNDRFGSTLCEGIIGRDFSNTWETRKHVVVDSLNCIKINSEAASMLVDILNQQHNQQPDNHLSNLLNEFSNRNFHCADSVVKMIFKKRNMENEFFDNMLIPLNGGLGYYGSTCSALLGGCLAIGILKGADAGKGGILETLFREIKMFTQGSAALKNHKLSPVSDAIILCSDLAEWFEEEFSSTLCRDITNVNFENKQQSAQYFSNDTISKCMLIGKQTSEKVRELIDSV